MSNALCDSLYIITFQTTYERTLHVSGYSAFTYRARFATYGTQRLIFDT